MKLIKLTVGLLFITSLAFASGQDYDSKSASGLSEAGVSVQTGSDGLSVEQRNIHDRLVIDNKIGSIKHLYVISAYSGQVLIYSTVKGKVTSSGKRLHPSTTSRYQENYSQEVLGDDGSYGTSVDYIYWWDTKGIYHQHYVQGGQIVHISDQPLAVKSIVINMEAVDENSDKKS